MIAPAIIKRYELEELFCHHVYDDDMIYFNGYQYANYIPDITPKENEYKWVILDDEKVIGYLSYVIDPNSDTVDKITVYSFDRGNPIIGLSVYNHIMVLSKIHRRIQFMMLDGNPAQKTYDKLIAHMSYIGKKTNKVTLHDVTKDKYGNYKNLHIYEIY